MHLALALSLLAGIQEPAAPAPDPRPNVLFLFADDQRPDTKPDQEPDAGSKRQPVAIALGLAQREPVREPVRVAERVAVGQASSESDHFVPSF